MKSEARQGHGFLLLWMRWKVLWVKIAISHFGLSCYLVHRGVQCYTHTKIRSKFIKNFEVKLKLLLMRRLCFVSSNAMLSKATGKLQNLSVLVFWRPTEQLPSDIAVDVS